MKKKRKEELARIKKAVILLVLVANLILVIQRCILTLRLSTRERLVFNKSGSKRRWKWRYCQIDSWIIAINKIANEPNSRIISTLFRRKQHRFLPYTSSPLTPWVSWKNLTKLVKNQITETLGPFDKFIGKH